MTDRPKFPKRALITEARSFTSGMWAAFSFMQMLSRAFCATE